jgi:hypothetical protein
MYTVTIAAVASPAAAFDLFEFNPAAEKPILLHRIRIDQITETAADEEKLGLTIQRAHSTSGSGGGTPTARPCVHGAAAASFAVETMNTTQATGGSPLSLMEDAWNTRSGYDMAFSPEERIGSVNGVRLVLQCTAPADAVTIRATVWVEEQG